jgi:tRNA dimethylallyltransferase
LHVEQRPQIRVNDTKGRGGEDRRLGVKRDAEPGGGEHRQVVGAVADGKGLGQRRIEATGKPEQCVAFRVAGHDRRAHGSGNVAVGEVEMVGDDMVETEFRRDTLGKNGKPAADQRGHSTVAAHHRDQRTRTRHRADAGRGLVENRDRQALQQRDALFEGGDEADLAVHRLSSDLGDLRPQSEEVGEFVEHLVFDDRRFHVGDEQPLAPLPRRLDHDIDRGLANDPPGNPLGGCGFDTINHKVAGLVGSEPTRCAASGQGLGDRDSDGGNGGPGAFGGDQGGDKAHARASYAEPASLRKPPVLIIGGPTASGKSALALELAAAFSGVVINGDALQIYRDLKILTARPEAAACARAPHRLYGILDAAERGSVGEWRRRALAEIAAATETGKLPIVVGGTGLYLRALIEGLAPFPEIPENVRDEAASLHRMVGGAEFRQRLAALDPETAARLAAGDSQRLTRAYAVVRATGLPIGAWRRRAHPAAPNRFATILMMPPRGLLYAACTARFGAMVERGALAEAAALAERRLDPSLPAMKAVGLPELIGHLRGETTLGEAIAAAQRATRRYAKRQMTWFRHQLKADLVLDEQFSESLLRCSRQFIDEFLLTHRG